MIVVLILFALLDSPDWRIREKATFTLIKFDITGFVDKGSFEQKARIDRIIKSTYRITQDGKVKIGDRIRSHDGHTYTKGRVVKFRDGFAILDNGFEVLLEHIYLIGDK